MVSTSILIGKRQRCHGTLMNCCSLWHAPLSTLAVWWWSGEVDSSQYFEICNLKNNHNFPASHTMYSFLRPALYIVQNALDVIPEFLICVSLAVYVRSKQRTLEICCSTCGLQLPTLQLDQQQCIGDKGSWPSSIRGNDTQHPVLSSNIAFTVTVHFEKGFTVCSEVQQFSLGTRASANNLSHSGGRTRLHSSKCPIYHTTRAGIV